MALKVAMAVLLALFLQGDEVRELIEQLRSDEPSVRDEATQKLVKMGPAAEADLRKVAEDRDKEVAERVRYLLRRIEIDRQLPLSIKKAFPNAVDVITSDPEGGWKRLYERRSISKRLAAELIPVLARNLATVSAKDEFCTYASRHRVAALMPLVKTYLQDPEPQVRLSAIRGAAYFRHGYEEALVPLLRDPDSRVRSQAFEKIEETGCKAAIPTLIELMNEGPKDWAEAIILTLSGVGSNATVDTLIAASKSESAVTRLIAVGTLTRMDARRALPDLVLRAIDSDISIAGRAIAYLGRCKYWPAAAKLIESASDADPARRKLAAEGLGSLGKTEAIPTLRKMRIDDNAEVRRAAIVALGRLGDPEIIPELALWLKDKDRDLALDIFQSLRNPGVVPFVLPLLRDRDSKIQKRALQILESSRDPSVAAKMVPFLKDFDSETILSAYETLGNLGYEGLGPILFDALREAPPDLKTEIIRLAEDLPGFEKQVLPLLKDGNPRVREEALSRLTRSNAIEALNDVVELMGDDDRCVAIRAYATLRNLQIREAAPHMTKLLDHPNTLTRELAFDLLALFDRASAAKELPRLLKGDDSPFQAIGLLDGAKGDAMILERLRSEESGDRRTLIEMAIDRKIAAAGPIVREFILKQVDSERHKMLHHVADVWPDELPPILDELSKCDDVQAHYSCIQLWAKLNRQDRVAAYLKHPSAALRTNALAYTTVAEEAIPFLNDPDPQIRIVAARSLGEVGDRRVIPALRKNLRDRFELARSLEALSHLDATEAMDDVVPLLNHEESEVRRQAINVVGLWGRAQDRERLIERLDDIYHPLRPDAVRAVARGGVRSAIPKLVAMLHSGDSVETPSAAAALVCLGAQESIPELLKRIKSADDFTRECGLYVIAKLGGKDWIPHLQHALDTGPRALREKVIEWLGDIRDDRSVSILKGRREKEALESLARLGSPTAAREIYQRAKSRGELFFLLNAARNPEGWARLERTSLEGFHYVWLDVPVWAIARAAGLTVVMPKIRTGFSLPEAVDPRYEWVPAWKALKRQAVKLSGYGYEMILDGSTLRVVPRAEAEALWDAWVRETK